MKLPITPYSGDQFGYYTVGPTFKTYSKLLAIEEMHRTGIHLEWHFNRPQYSQFDWRQEPPETLEELYRRRAQQIRDNYDYIVVWYSGGPDSWCVLDSFIRNNIKIDEIGQFHSYEADRDQRSNFNEEIFFTAVPKTKQILEQHPDIKHRIVDVSQLIDQVYRRQDVRYDYFYNIKAIASANSLARAYLRDYIDDYKKIIDSGRRLCFIWGTEKPRIFERDGKYHTYFIDAFSDTNIRIQDLAGQGYYDEWFFWSPDTAPLIAKQCHTLMRALRAFGTDSPYMVNKSWGPHSAKSKVHGKYLRNDIYHTLVYPGWDPSTLVAVKPQNLLVSERDDWFWQQGTNNESVKHAWGGITELMTRLGRYGWLNDATDWTRGIKGCINHYPLE